MDRPGGVLRHGPTVHGPSAGPLHRFRGGPGSDAAPSAAAFGRSDVGRAKQTAVRVHNGRPETRLAVRWWPPHRPSARAPPRRHCRRRSAEGRSTSVLLPTPPPPRSRSHMSPAPFTVPRSWPVTPPPPSPGMYWKGRDLRGGPRSGSMGGWRRLPKRLGAVTVGYKCH